MDQNKGEKLGVKEVSAILRESPNVVRSWIKDFRPYIPIDKGENGYNAFGAEAVAVFRRIKKLYREQNYSKRQIAAALAGVSLGGIETAAAAEPAAPSAVADPAALADLAAKVEQLLEGQKRMAELLEGQKRIEALHVELLARLDAPPALPEPAAEEKHPGALRRIWNKLF